MSKWEKVKLGDICTVVSGTTPKSNIPEYWNGNYNWVTPAEITDNTVFVNETQRKITDSAIASTSLKAFPSGTVLLSSRAPIGKVAIAGTEMYCNQGFKNLICSKKIYNKYLFWFLKSKSNYLNSLGRGATFKEISKPLVEKVEVPLPPLEEQHKIASILDTVSEALKLRKQQLKELDLLVKSKFEEMFGNPVENPYKWDVKYLENICDVRDGTHDSPKYTNEGYPLITSKNITHGEINFKNCNLISKEDFENINKRSKVNIGDIIMPMIGTIGNPIIVTSNIEFAIKNVALIKFNKGYYITNIYVKTLLESDYLEKSIVKSKRGGTQKFIALGDIRKLCIPVPPIELQNKFASFVEHVDGLKSEVQKSINQLQTLFDSLMQQYFE